VIGHTTQQSVVVRASGFEERGQIKEWLRQYITLDKKESDEQASDAPVAVEEWMDGLELVVGHGDLDEAGPGEDTGISEQKAAKEVKVGR
jgi:hypothetical protein